MIIQHNLMSMYTSKQLKVNGKKKASSAEKLASGYRINKAADDAAGLFISEKMRTQIRGLQQASNNIQDGIGYIQTADGALGEVTDILQRMRTLAVQAANDTNTEEDRSSIDIEIEQLKEEVDRIFENTEFNDRKIWDVNTKNRIQVGTVPKQAVTISNGSQSYTITDLNKGAVPYSGYTVDVVGTDPEDASTYGIKVTWTGYNNKNYSTKLIGWDQIEGTDVSFRLADHLDLSTDNELTGIDFTFSYRTEESATLGDIAKGLDGVNISAYPVTNQSIVNSNGTGDIQMSVSVNYLAELASGRLMNVYDTVFMEPDLSGNPTSNVLTPDYNNSTDTTGLIFKFDMNNIGQVTGNCNSIYYYSSDRSAQGEGKWWKYVTYGTTTVKSAISYSPDLSGTGLDAILSCVDRSDGYSVSKDANGGGVIVLNFSLNSDSAYTYSGRSSSSVGSMTVTIRVSEDDTGEDIKHKLETGFNATSVIDIYTGNKVTGNPSQAYHMSYNSVAKTSIIDVPVYKATHDLPIQTGANAGQAIHLIYDSLRTSDLGIYNTNVLTREEASNAIGEVEGAIIIVSEQRASFGAYENRLQHAYENGKNTAENLQASESRIRDLDVAEEMVTFSKQNILEQAATAILAQSSRDRQMVLELLKM